MQSLCKPFSYKQGLRPGILALVFATIFCGQIARATVYSTNTGTIPNTGIQYTITLEDDVTSRMAIRFKLKNTSAKPYFIERGAFDVPGNLSVFFSTDDTPIINSTGEWASDSLPSGSVMGNLALLPGKSVDEIFPIGVYYDKIYKKRRETNIYVYWGITMPNNSDDAEQAERENRTLGTVTREILPRVGGMLTLPKKIDD